jgi:hypothetical protein
VDGVMGVDGQVALEHLPAPKTYYFVTKKFFYFSVTKMLKISAMKLSYFYSKGKNSFCS